MKKLFLIVVAVFVSCCCFAQYFSKADKKNLRSKEDSLKGYAIKIIEGRNINDKFDADSIFTKVLVRTLKIPNSFFYPFDSLESISKLYAPDSSFRIFTWQIVLDDNIIFQHGAIQMRTVDGSLKLFPLIDKSEVINNIDDTVANNRAWIGAIYYRIIETKYKNKNYYTLLGYDEDNIRCNRKIIEVLTFDDNHEPVFGGNYFVLEKTLVEKPAIARYIIEYKKDAAPKLNYDNDLGMIIIEHLVSETGEPDKKWTLIPDGDYIGFKWANGKWVYVDKVFSYITPEGQSPTPNPVLDPAGNIDQSKLKHTLPTDQ
jgi:hypothetical protein